MTPKLQMSAFVVYAAAAHSGVSSSCIITSGAMNRGVPATVRRSLNVLNEVDRPKSESFTLARLSSTRRIFAGWKAREGERNKLRVVSYDALHTGSPTLMSR